MTTAKNYSVMETSRIDVIKTSSHEFFPNLIGTVVIEANNLKHQIFVHRELWIEKMAYVGGFNIFCLVIVNFILRLIVKRAF